MRILSSIAAFVEERSGLVTATRALFEPQEGHEKPGARLTAALWNALVILFVVQCITGLFLSLTYTPSATGAWASVAYIQQKVVHGWFLRGLHGYAGEAMLLVFGFHLVQLVFVGAYRKPHEIRWWLTLAFGGLLLGLLITGMRLPWDQHSYWALQVELNIAAALPVLGAPSADLVAGGATPGQSTLTRLYAAHVVLLPVLVAGVVLAVRALGIRNGVPGSALRETETPKTARRIRAKEWALNLLFALLVLLAVSVVTALTEGKGLTAPADPSRDFPARPEWFLLPLYELRKVLPDAMELVATVVLPGLLGAFLFAMPLLDRGASSGSTLRQRFVWLAPVLVTVVGMGLLTQQSLAHDAADEEVQEALAKARTRAERSLELAAWGIPPEGPLEMLRNDPFTRGKELFAQYCASCHVLHGEGERKAPDHTGFASRQWIRMLLEAPGDDHFFGLAELKEDMPSQRALGDEGLTQITEFLFSLGVEPPDGDRHPDKVVDASLVVPGEQLFRRKCLRCHLYEGDGDFMGVGGPNLTRWASRTWISRQVSHPDGMSQYGDLNEMPAFSDQLDAHDIRMVTAYLRAERFRTPDFEVSAE